MGKTRTSFKNEAREKVPLDQQITAGKVARGGKNKLKIRLRAEEEDVSSMTPKKIDICSKLTIFVVFHSTQMHGQRKKSYKQLVLNKPK